MPLIVLDGDTGSHGGTVSSGCEKTYAEGKLIVRQGDIYTCSEHGENPIVVSGTTKTYAEGKLIAVEGAVAQCGAIIHSSAEKSYAEGY